MSDIEMAADEYGRKSTEWLERENSRLRFELKNMAELLRSYAKSLDEINTNLDAGAILTVPFIELYLKGIGVDLAE